VKKIFILLLILAFVPSIAQLPAVDLMKGQRKVRIPFTYYYNFILVKANLQGFIPVELIFDTGAENTILFQRTITDIAGVKYDQKIKLRGSDQSKDITASIARKVAFTFKNRGLTEMDIIVLDEDIYQMHEVVGKEIQGILGANFFKGLVVEINYHKRYIDIYRPESFKLPKGQWTTSTLNVVENKPYIECPTILEGHAGIGLNYLIDTGAGVPVLIHNNTHEAIDIPTHSVPGYLGSGLGGQLNGYLSRIERIGIQNYQLDNLILGFQTIDSVRLQDPDFIRNGLIGNPILRKFHVIIDFSHEKLHLRKSKYYKEEIAVDRSGLYLYAAGSLHNRFIVKDILANSPASEAGILPGDEIIRVNGWSIFWYDLNKLVRKFQQKESKIIKLTLLRNGQKFNTTLTLRNLFTMHNPRGKRTIN